MPVYVFISSICWSVFLLYWLISAFGVKKNISTAGWWRGIYVRLAILAVLILLLRLPVFKHAFERFVQDSFVTQNPLIGSVGALLCVAGISFAIWARVHLGRNWGMPMSHKENAELVVTGPYAYVRHPIYTGVILAFFGSTLTDGVVWLVPLIASMVYFTYSALMEEKLMMREFPDQYPAYKRRTKMLIPWLL